MNGFTSGTQARDGRIVNHDPKPWTVLDQAGRVVAHSSERGEHSYRSPRPKFNVLDNPILAAFRSAIADDDPYADADSWLANLSDMSAESEVWAHDSAHIEHARRVLSKLVALA